jgi:predicted nuclease of restriction endonuclease-like (RecB) superfamily
MPPRAKPTTPQLELLSDVRNLIEQARHQAVLAVNAELSLLYWDVGTRINQEVLKNTRAEYGKQIIKHLADSLSLEYGNGWSEAQLRHCLQFAKTFPDAQIVSALRRQLSWTKIKTLLYIKDDLKRMFYLEMTQLENWSSRQLQERINSQLFERTALSKKPEETIRADLEQLRQTKKVTPEILLKDPYILDFLGLKDRYLEKDLEDAILREIELFLLELGAGFTFVAR